MSVAVCKTCTHCVLSSKIKIQSTVLSPLYLFDLRYVSYECCVVNKVIQLPQLTQVLHIILPNHLKKGQRSQADRVEDSLSRTRLEQTSAISSARPGLQSSNQRRGVMPFVLFWNLFGSKSLKSRNLKKRKTM